MQPVPRKQQLAAALALFALNAWLCWPLFGAGYLSHLESNEGSFISFATFVLKYWPHVRWFSWFNCGIPYEDTYLPLVPALTAFGAWLTSATPAHAFHVVAALAYSLAPATLFLFAVKLSGRAIPSFAAALMWTLLSPSVLLPAVRANLGAVFGLRRLQTVVTYGEVPHAVAICLMPVALLAIYRYLERCTARRFAIGVLASAAVMLANAFGIVVVAFSAAALAATYDRTSWKRLPSIAAMLLAGYAIICRFIPPSLLLLIQVNSQTVGGDYRPTLITRLLSAVLLAVLVVLSRVVLRLPDRALRFAILFLTCFGSITVLGHLGFALAPQPERYHLELEIGVCLVAAFALAAVQLKRARPALVALALVAGGWVLLQDYSYARALIQPADLQHNARIREAHWLGQHRPDERVMLSGDGEFWFNAFETNPQLSGGHDPSAPNWVQRVAVYTIYTGQNAGDRDGPDSVLWLKAFGAAAITVPGPQSDDATHPILNPRKFDGLLPLIWREGDDSIYQVPLRTPSLAHVIPEAAVVHHRPAHGLDVAEVRQYVAALENPKLSDTRLVWRNPESGTITASAFAGQVFSLQMSYDPGWRASVAGRSVAVSKDELGLTVITPNCNGPCTVDLAFTEGSERTLCDVVSAAALVLLGVALMGVTPANNRTIL